MAATCASSCGLSWLLMASCTRLAWQAVRPGGTVGRLMEVATLNVATTLPVTSTRFSSGLVPGVCGQHLILGAERRRAVDPGGDALFVDGDGVDFLFFLFFIRGRFVVQRHGHAGVVGVTLHRWAARRAAGAGPRRAGRARECGFGGGFGGLLKRVAGVADADAAGLRGAATGPAACCTVSAASWASRCRPAAEPRSGAEALTKMSEPVVKASASRSRERASASPPCGRVRSPRLAPSVLPTNSASP